MPTSDSLHVLHVLHTFPPHSYGGIETYVERLARAQVKDGVRVTILAGCEGQPPGDASADPPALTEEEVDGLRVLRFGPAPPSRGQVNDPHLGSLFSELLEHEQVRLVHVHHWHNLNTSLAGRSREAGVPAVITLHDYFAICPLFFRIRDGVPCPSDVPHETCVECIASESDLAIPDIRAGLQERNRLLRSELERAAARLTLSNEQTDYLRQVPALRGLELTLLMLPQPDLQPQHTHEARSIDRLRIVSWGTLVPGKGMLTVVRACESLREPEQIETHHYGRTIDADHAAELTQAARRTRLVLHGSFDETTMQREFSQYDLAVFPSMFRETWGYTVDEAMALGLPVVVSDRGAPGERIGGRGVLFPAGNVQALRDVFQRFLDQPGRLDKLRAETPPPGLSITEHWALLGKVYEQALA